MSRVVVTVHGDVQGVGFRWFTRTVLRDLGLVGSAQNLPDGTVEVDASGERAALDRLLAALEGPTAPGRVDRLVPEWVEA